MRTVLALCAETVLLDARTNNLSLINIVEELHSPVFPLFVPRLNFSATLDRLDTEPSVVELQLEGWFEMGKPIFHAPLPVDFQQRKRTRVIAELSGLVIPTPGELHIALKEGDSRMDAWTIIVHAIGQQPSVDLFPVPARPQNA